MSAEINTIIDNLCERFATPASELLVEIARMETAECIVSLVLSIIGIAAAIVLFRIASKLADDDDNEVKFGFCLVSGGFIGLFSLIVFFVAMPSLVQWLVAPRAKAITWILKLL